MAVENKVVPFTWRFAEWGFCSIYQKIAFLAPSQGHLEGLPLFAWNFIALDIYLFKFFYDEGYLGYGSRLVPQGHGYSANP